MANTVQIKRGNNTSVNAHTGPSGELIYNLDTGRLHAQDGSTAGGKPHALISDVDLKANAATQVIAGDGLTGGGTLAANRTLALSSASIASLSLADSAVQSVNGKTGSSITLTKADVGLSNVDNTSDLAKPISTATQTALNAKANSAITVSAGTGLTGGGNLTANRTVALNAASIASLGKADTALQAPGGAAGQILAKNSATTNDVVWVSSEAATAVSYGPQTLTVAQQGQARANIAAGTYSYNWIINGNFTINQRWGVKKPANGVYGYDRWKGHPNGIEQVVEALPAGEYTLTWSGGGNGTFGGVTGVSPIKATVSAGNTSVVVPQTATKVSLVEGDATSEADPFSPRHIQQELALCQRYYEVFSGVGITGYQQAGNGLVVPASFKVVKRVTPTTGINSWDAADNASTPVTARTTVNGTEVQTVAVATGVVYVVGIIGFADAEFY